VEAYEGGYRSFKVKGGSDPDHDIAVYLRLREVMPEAGLYIDANLGYDWTDALRVARTLAPHGLRWIEEPLAPGDPMRTKLWTQTGVAVLADETATTARAAWEQIRDGAAQIISIKVSRTGVAESLRIAALCASAGVPIVVGTQGESALGTHLAAEVTAALGAARLLTTELSHDQVFTGQIATTGVTRSGSELLLSTTPDELTIDRKALADYAT
jgi:L-alanine-DL-glutamate epimerase-like enolase superfamily enzyme